MIEIKKLVQAIFFQILDNTGSKPVRGATAPFFYPTLSADAYGYGYIKKIEEKRNEPQKLLSIAANFSGCIGK